jgi:hypothetical protein
VSQTNVTRDLEYLETIVARNPEEYVVKQIKESKSYSNQYEHLDPNTLYIKIGKAAWGHNRVSADHMFVRR